MTKSVQVLHGQEFFLIDDFIKKQQANFSDASTHSFSEQFELNDLAQATQGGGLFSSKSFIVVKNPWFFSKQLSDKQLEQLLSIIAQCSNPDICLIICQYGNIDQRKKTVTRLKKVAQFHKFEPFKDWEQDKFKQWLKNHLALSGKSIEHRALQMATDLFPKALRAAAAECDTLCTYIGDKESIDIDDIKAIANDQQLSIYQFLEQMKKRQFNSLYKCIQQLQHMGEDPIKLLGLVTATLRQNLQILYAKERNISMDALAKQIGKNPYFLKLLLKDIQGQYSAKDCMTLLTQCADLDYQVKSGQVKAGYILKALPSLIGKTPLRAI